jgi:AcrR family transcriptional regulator
MPKIIEDEKVYLAVLQSVVERGYAGATTKQMAEAADVSEVTLFRKYVSKLQLVKRAIASIAEQTDFESAVKYTGDINSDLLRVVQAYHDSVGEYGQFFAVLLYEMPRYPELMEIIDTPLNIFQRIGHLLARYQAEGVLRQEHPLHAVATLLGPMIYIAMMRGAMQESPPPPLDLSNHVAGFLEGHRLAV